MDLGGALGAALAGSVGNAIFAATDPDRGAQRHFGEEPGGHLVRESDAAVAGWIPREDAPVKAHGGGSSTVMEAHKVFHEGSFEAGSGWSGVKSIFDVTHDGPAAFGNKISVAARAVIQVFLAYGVVASFRAVVFPAAGDSTGGDEFVVVVEIGALSIQIDDEEGIGGGDAERRRVGGQHAVGFIGFEVGVHHGDVCGRNQTIGSGAGRGIARRDGGVRRFWDRFTGGEQTSDGDEQRKVTHAPTGAAVSLGEKLEIEKLRGMKWVLEMR